MKKGGGAFVFLGFSKRRFRYKILYASCELSVRKPLRWVGSSYNDLLGFPIEVRRSVGFQLDKIQSGGDPDDWKPFGSAGVGVREVRVREASGAFRVMYVAKFASAIYVLHCFQKKSQATSGGDVQIARARYQMVVKMEAGKK